MLPKIGETTYSRRRADHSRASCPLSETTIAKRFCYTRRPTAWEQPHNEAGHAKAPDQMPEPEEASRVQRSVHIGMTPVAIEPGRTSPQTSEPRRRSLLVMPASPLNAL
jgi:hypothetical protein